MKLVCHREGRQGYHVGDVVNVPDDVDSFDGTYFRVVPDAPAAKPAPEAKKPEPPVEKTEKDSDK